MTASIRETIIAAAVAAVDAATAVTVYRSRAALLSVGQLPAIVISPVRDTPAERDGSLCWQSWDLELSVDVVVAAEPPDQVADPLVQLIHAALMGGARNLGIDAVTDIAPLSSSFMAADQGGATGFTRCPFIVRYRTRQDDLAS